MNIAIDVSPLQTGHKIRGTGFYLEHLKKSLQEYYPENTYTFFTKVKDVTKPVDLIHYPYFEPFFLTLPLKKKFPTIVTVHDLTPLRFPRLFPSGIKGKIKWNVQKVALSMSDAVITDSISSKKDIQKFTNIHEDKIHVVYLAAGEEFQRVTNMNCLKTIKQKYKLPEKFVLYVGDATANKNLPRLVAAAKSMEIPFVFVGKSLAESVVDSNNQWNKDLISVQKSIKKEKNMHLLGFVPTEDLVLLYNAATLAVVPSLYEGFGLPVLEAMQSGCPVVTTKEGSLPEVAKDAACYVNAYDTESIASGIKSVFSDKTLQEKLRVAGQKKASEFTWKKTAGMTIDVYKSIMK